MTSKARIIFFLLPLITSTSFAQYNDFLYKRHIEDPNQLWHKIILPNNIFGSLAKPMADIRIIGITSTNDTIEAPYLLKYNLENVVVRKVDFNLINQSSNDEYYYYTFEVPAKNTISDINLDFKQENFDWKVTLQGSHDQNKWFLIKKESRILSIKNADTDYSFTKIKFPASNYKYIRIFFKSKEDPDLQKANLLLTEVEEGNYQSYKIVNYKISQNKEENFTLAEVTLDKLVPVSKLKINVKEKFDYYRPITIEYLRDSFKTEKGWKHNYSNLATATLSSLEENDFKFTSTLTKKIRLKIFNFNNQQVTINNIEVEGNILELLARFTQPANYYLIYGNKKAINPNYDITYFKDKIPDSLQTLSLGEEQIIEKKPFTKSQPLFTNKVSLWVVMVLIIIILGWFSIKMMRGKELVN